MSLAKSSYSSGNKDPSKNPDYLYITSTKQGVRYNRLKPILYEPCDIGYHSSTGHGPLCVACPLSSTNILQGQTKCNICRNGYFGINGESPCHEYYTWLPYAVISMYTTAVVIAAFVYSNKRYLLEMYKKMKKKLEESNNEDEDKSHKLHIENPDTENGNNNLNGNDKNDEESKLIDSQEDHDDDGSGSENANEEL